MSDDDQPQIGTLGFYTPLDWYWVHGDGRIYASARQALVAADDAGFVAAQAAGRFTRWPADEAGAESDAELDAVLAPYGLSLAGPLPPKLTFLQFMDLFTETEQIAIAQAAMADAATKLWYDRALGATEIDFADPRLAAGLQSFVSAGLMTSARRNRVLKGLKPA